MTRRWIGALLAVALLAVAGGAVLLPYLSLAAPKRIQDLVYRRMTYTVIAHRIAAAGSPRQQDLAKRLAEYVHDTVFFNVELPTQGAESFFLDNLVSGLGVCYHHSLGLATLGYHAGLDGRARGMGGPAAHSVGELKADGQWRYLDTLFGLIFTDEATGEILTAEQLEREPGESLKAEAFKRYDPQMLETYRKFYPMGTWGPYSSSQGLQRRLLSFALRKAVEAFGAAAFHAYQDRYFAGGWTPDSRSGAFFGQALLQDRAFLEFYKARNFHLWGRFEQARAGYRQLAASSTAWTDDALMFLGRSYLDEGRPAEAIAPLARAREEFPGSIWHEPSAYWLAMAYEQQGQLTQAKQLYETIKQVQGLDGSLRLLRFEHPKLTRRDP